MSQILGTIIAAQVTTGDTVNTFPIGDENEMLGGHHSVQQLSDRDAIPAQRRVEGMTCYVVVTQRTFQLVGGTNNGNWADATGSGGAALTLAQVGTATADVALGVAVAGTNLAYTALTTAWTGTATADVAVGVAVAGTNLAYTALTTAWTGTAAQALANLTDVSLVGPTAQQLLSWNGSKWTNSDGPTATAPLAFTYYLDQAASGTAGYDSLLSLPSGAPEEVTQATATVGGGPVFMGGFISGLLNRTLLDSGVWEFNTFATVDYGTNSAQMITDFYKRDISGSETYLFSGTSNSFSAYLEPDLLDYEVTQGTFATALTDKLVVKYWTKTSSSTVLVSFYHCGTAHDTHIHTPLRTSHNDLAGLQGGTTEQYYHMTADQWAALAGTDGYPSASDPFVTNSDSRLAVGAQALSLAETGTNLAYTALTTAWTGTSASGLGLAVTAYNLAATGTATANVALSVAGQGTDAAANAITLANAVLVTAEAGTSAAAAALLVAEAGTTAAANGINLANSAFVLAETGTNAAAVANSLAYTALTTAWTGTATSGSATASQALALAEVGTRTADTALSVAGQGTNLAYTALTTAWVGTATANVALSVAGAGTNLAYTALTTAWVGTATANVALSVAGAGTNAAANAITLANSALTAAFAGTASSNIMSVAATGATSGTITFDFSGSHYQTVALTGDGTFSTANRVSGASITARIDANGSNRNLYFNGGWSFLTAIPTSPTALNNGKVGILSLTSFGVAEANVIAVYAATP